MIRETITSRGFVLLSFLDRNGNLCNMQESSIATEPCIWLGFADGDRMHLTQAQVAELLPILQQFVNDGSISQSGKE